MSLEKTGIQDIAGRLASDRSDTASTVTGDKKPGGSRVQISVQVSVQNYVNPDGFYFLRIESISK